MSRNARNSGIPGNLGINSGRLLPKCSQSELKFCDFKHLGKDTGTTGLSSSDSYPGWKRRCSVVMILREEAHSYQPPSCGFLRLTRAQQAAGGKAAMASRALPELNLVHSPPRALPSPPSKDWFCKHFSWSPCFLQGLWRAMSPTGPLSENNKAPTKVGQNWVSINVQKWVQKWVKSGFWVQKWVKYRALRIGFISYCSWLNNDNCTLPWSYYAWESGFRDTNIRGKEWVSHRITVCLHSYWKEFENSMSLYPYLLWNIKICPSIFWHAAHSSKYFSDMLPTPPFRTEILQN